MFREMEDYAFLNHIPIMQSDGIEFLCKYIVDNHIKNILEIGSAIGYSAIRMASLSANINVTTIEKDINRYRIAVNNIDKYNLNKRIKIINEDAIYCNIEDKFDLIFIDASKSNNIVFFEKYKECLTDKGVIITDNLSFHGLVENNSLIETKNQRGIVRHIKKYIEFLDNNKEFDTEYVMIGDKISISKKRRNVDE